MRHLIVRLIINVAALLVVVNIPGLGITFSGQPWGLVVVALIFGVVNSVVRPILLGVGCLINMVTLGLFTFVVNALMLMLTDYLSHMVQPQLQFSFNVNGFISALVGAIIISVVSAVLSAFIRENRRR
jgi:putative membrane protein